MPELMTLDELASYLRLTKRTMYRLLKENELPAIKVGHQWRFDKAAIDGWLRQNSTQGAAEILVIDDDESICNFFRDTLAGSGMKISATQDSAEGLRLIKEKDYDLVFIDLRMPVMDGAELLRQIRLVKPDLPVTIITGYSDSELMTNALENGPLGVMKKPFTAAEIISAAQNYLRFGSRKK